MIRAMIAAALLSLPALAAAGEGNVQPKTPGQTIAGLMSFTAPKGWTKDEYENADGAEPVLRFEKLSDTVQIRVFGAPGSDYPTVKEFLAGPAASEEGRPPEKTGAVTVAGRKLPLYLRRIPLVIQDPHGPRQPQMYGSETFCVLPLRDGRFAMLAYRRETPAPDMDRRGEKAWAAFLKTVKPK